MVLRQRGQTELTAEDSIDVSNDLPLVHDIVIAWSHAHGFAHLRLEGQLSLVCEEVEAQVLRHVSQRLSELVQQRHDYSSK